jgi:hypothetical protein
MVALADSLTMYLPTNRFFFSNTFRDTYGHRSHGMSLSRRQFFTVLLGEKLYAEYLLSIGCRVNGLSQCDINLG